jgi:hypothetical protein
MRRHQQGLYAQIYKELLQFRVLGLGLLQDEDVGVGVFSKGENG